MYYCTVLYIGTLVPVAYLPAGFYLFIHVITCHIYYFFILRLPTYSPAQSNANNINLDIASYHTHTHTPYRIIIYLSIYQHPHLIFPSFPTSMLVCLPACLYRMHCTLCYAHAMLYIMQLTPPLHPLLAHAQILDPLVRPHALAQPPAPAWVDRQRLDPDARGEPAADGERDGRRGRHEGGVELGFFVGARRSG